MTTLIVEALPSHVEPGAHISNLYKQHGEGTRIFLTPSTTYLLQTPIYLSHASQVLATLNYLVDSTRAVLQTRGSTASAIAAHGLSHIVIRNVIVDGCEPELGRTEHAEPMVFVGAPGSVNACVMDCVLTHTRGWTCLHAADLALGTKIINNHVGPSGHPAPDGPWADGLSVAVRDGIIVGNTVIDATDGAIVLFCCPGTVVSNNTIIAETRDLLGGINLVDMGVFDGDYTGTRVFSNRFISDSAYTKLAIGMGPLTWGDMQIIGCRGATVENNTLVSGRFGYGFAAAGCSDVTVRGNVVLPAVQFEGDSIFNSELPAPSAFVKSSNKTITSGDFQPEFYDAYIRFLIGIQPRDGKQKRYYPGGLALRSGERIQLKTAFVELPHDGNLLVVSNNHRILWQSNSGYQHVKSANLCFSPAHGLQILDGDKRPLWNPSASLPKLPTAKKTSMFGGPYLLFKDSAPYLQIFDDAGNITYASQYLFPPGWQLDDGCFVAIPSLQLQKQQSSPSVTWLYLDPSTSQAILHTSRIPDQIEKGQEVWRSNNFKMPPKGESSKGHQSKLVLQGDGNLVIYRDGDACWASGTGGVEHIALFGHHEHGGPRLELLDSKGGAKWSTVCHS